jgi:hypothetical protein
MAFSAARYSEDAAYFSYGPYGKTLSYASGYVMTRGNVFIARKPNSVVIGVTSWTGRTGSHDVKVSIWTYPGAALLKTKTQTCNGVGVNRIYFDTPLLITASDVAHNGFMVGKCEVGDGDSYIASLGVADLYIFPGVSYQVWAGKTNQYKQLDAYPNTGIDGVNGSPVDPIIQYPSL